MRAAHRPEARAELQCSRLRPSPMLIGGVNESLPPIFGVPFHLL